MPLINGLKMACEPCIRGHRSTKCTHANERLMVPVRKPGRPLSTCPHPPSRTGCECGSASVTAAIPRKQKCGCGTSSTTAELESIKSESPASDEPPLSPTKASTPFRIQKSGPKLSNRKQSFDPANLERMDINHVNILHAYDVPQANGMPHHPNGIMSGMPTPGPGLIYSPMPLMAPNGTFQNPIAFPMFAPNGLGEHQTPGISRPLASVPGTPSMNGASKVPLTPSMGSTASVGGSCCSGPTNGKKSTQPSSINSSINSSPKSATKPANGSCCSGANTSPTLVSAMVSGPQIPSSNGALISPFQTPVPLNQNLYHSYFPQPTIFTYPPQYGSYLSPLQPAQWRQAMETLHFGQPVPPPNSFDIATPIAFHPENAAPPSDAGTTHLCSCGDTCNCIGCAAHPYNEATQNYVRSAWNSMVEEPYAHTNGKMEPSATNGSAAHGHGPALGDGGASPPPPQTPSDTNSAISEEQTLSASDFFFVTYPFGDDSCAGEMASCPCGDDCQCLGCSIHNNDPPPIAEV